MKLNASTRRRTLCVLVLAASAFALTGCNTVTGVMRDVTGAFDGMMYQSETNGQSPRGIRGN